MRIPIPILPLLLTGVAVAVCLLPRRGHTVPRYAALTGLPCGRCHFDPEGGGARNAFGFRYAKNRHLLDVADPTPDLAGDTLSNRVSGKTTIFLGADQRFSLFMRQYSRESRPERLSFLEMESLIHLAFQPHPGLTLVYALQDMGDGAAHMVRSREAFGLLAGMPWNGYLKAGRFLVPFGLRMEDPEVATRGGLGGGIVGGNFLPFDPQLPDMGVEVGVGSRGFFGRASFTNGHSNLFSNGYAEAKVVKVGYGGSRFHSGLSLHDDFSKVGGTPFVRYTYWSGYALARAGPVVLIGEVSAGTNALRPAASPPYGRESTSLAGFTELDWAPSPRHNLRLRYDRLERGRNQGQPARDMSTFDRYSLESEWAPVRYARVRSVYRFTDTEFAPSMDEHEAFVEFQFSY